MIQLTLIQIDNYGPWTTTPKPKRESYLQTLQAEAYSALQEEFSARKSLLFPMRYDNMMAVTNGMNTAEHREIMERFNRRFPVSISMSLASAKTPYEAQTKATRQLAEEGGSRNRNRKASLKGVETSSDPVQIAHIDVNGITGHTDVNVYDSYGMVVDAEKSLIKHLKPFGALVFYMGGDNFISPCNNTTKQELLGSFRKAEEETGLTLKAGIGIGRTAEEAVKLASLGLKEIRLGARDKIVVKDES